MRNISDKSCRENQNTHSFAQYIFLENCAFFFLDNVEKYRRAGEATDDNMAHAHCMLDT
jgi:hypothetical protein